MDAGTSAGRRFAIAPTIAIGWTKVVARERQIAPAAGQRDFLLVLDQEPGDSTPHEMAARSLQDAIKATLERFTPNHCRNLFVAAGDDPE